MYVDLDVLVCSTVAVTVVPVAMGQMGAPVINTRMNALNGLNFEHCLIFSCSNRSDYCNGEGECIEELVEANSNISESRRSIIDQSINYVKTETTGYKVIYPTISRCV